MTEYEQSEKELLNAESIFKELEDQKLLARTYSLRSILLGRLGEYDEELKSLLKSYEINLKIDNFDAQVSNLQNLSLKYLDRNNLDSAKIILKKLDELKEYVVDSDLYYYNQNWGKYYSELGEYEIALDYYNNALNFAETYDMVDSKATMLMCIGEACKQKGEIDKAEKFSYMSYAFSDANNLIYEKSEALMLMVEIAEEKGDFQAAFKFQKELIIAEKEIFNLEKLNKVKQVKTQLDLAEKEKEIEAQKVIAAEKDLEHKTAEARNYMLLITLIAVLLILMLLSVAFIKNKKLYEIIKSQKSEVEHKNIIISEALKDIEDSLTYSKFIQNALLPSEQKYKECFEDFFILYEPKEKVSGDFYWMHQSGKEVYFCVADCTGHGVPGALVSVVGANALNTCIKKKKM